MKYITDGQQEQARLKKPGFFRKTWFLIDSESPFGAEKGDCRLPAQPPHNLRRVHAAQSGSNTSNASQSWRAASSQVNPDACANPRATMS